jgi:5'-3' exonuclease
VTGALLAVDGPSLMYRAFFALPSSITDDDGHPVNALLGSANQILWAIERHRPRAVVVCFGAEAAVYRKELYEPYHAARPAMPPELERQWRKAPAFYEAFAWTVIDHDTLEADDLLGSLATAETEAGGATVLFTGDRDMFQCVSEHVGVLYPGGKDGPTLIDAAEVRTRYRVRPDQVPDFIALRGDPSDGLPGARGIGEKTAAELLRVHGTLETAIANAASERPRVAAALRDQAQELRAFKEIASLVQLPIERPDDRPTDFVSAAVAARGLGMARLGERLDGFAAA